MLREYRKQILAGLAVLTVVVAYLVGDTTLTDAIGQAVTAATNGF